MGIQLRKMMRSRVIVVFGAMSRIGRATIEALTSQQEVSVTVVAAVENVKEPRARRMKKATNCFLVKCRFGDLESIQRVVRNADSVLLVPALSESGTRFSKRVIDAVQAEQVPRLVIISSILATNDFWRHHVRETAPAAGENPNDLGYEAVEAHARSNLENCVSLRIPLLMETIMYCREEIMFANRFASCFNADTLIPCIAVSDVAAAASHVLTHSTQKFNTTYCLANENITCSPTDMEQLLSRSLGKYVKYRQVSDEELVELLCERGATQYVAQSIVRFKTYLETGDLSRQAATIEEEEEEEGEKPAHAPTRAASTAEEARRLQLARFGYTNDFQVLARKPQMTPRKWLDANVKHFMRSPQNQMQLFVVGSGEGLFVEIERFLAMQVTSATTAPMADVGEAAIPTATGSAQQSKVTFCAIKSVPSTAAEPAAQPAAHPHPQSMRGGRGGGHFYQMAGGALSPMNNLLKQLSSLDVVVYIPPLRLGAEACMEVTKSVVGAAAKSNAWGIVVVSTIFTGLAADDSINRMGEMEQFIERSGVPYVIVRLPLFMEYFLALSSSEPPLSRGESEEEGQAAVSPVQGAQAQQHAAEEEEKLSVREPSGLQPTTTAAGVPAGVAAPQQQPHAITEKDESYWNLLDRSLESSRQYLIAQADAAKALVSVAFTFPLHRNHVRTLYTECMTMQEIEEVLQKHAYKGRRIDFSQVNGLHEAPEREFWRMAYWTKSHIKQFLECSVALSAHEAPIVVSKRFDEVTECEPISLENWARANAKSYTHALEVAS